MIAADDVNVLAAAWLQFMIRDWFSHGTDVRTAIPWQIALRARRPVARPTVTVLRTTARPDRPTGAGLAADLDQHRDALVGRLADLRHHARVSAGGPHRHAAASCGSTPTA